MGLLSLWMYVYPLVKECSPVTSLTNSTHRENRVKRTSEIMDQETNHAPQSIKLVCEVGGVRDIVIEPSEGFIFGRDHVKKGSNLTDKQITSISRECFHFEWNSNKLYVRCKWEQLFYPFFLVLIFLLVFRIFPFLDYTHCYHLSFYHYFLLHSSIS